MPDVERVSNQAILDAVAQALDDERAYTDSRLAHLDGNELLKSAAVVLVEAKLKALRQRYGGIGTRTSKVVSGTPPAPLKDLWSAP